MDVTLGKPKIETDELFLGTPRADCGTHLAALFRGLLQQRQAGACIEIAVAQALDVPVPLVAQVLKGMVREAGGKEVVG